MSSKAAELAVLAFGASTQSTATVSWVIALLLALALSGCEARARVTIVSGPAKINDVCQNPETDKIIDLCRELEEQRYLLRLQDSEKGANP